MLNRFFYIMCAISLLAASCATSKGDAFDKTINGIEKRADQKSRADKEDRNPVKDRNPAVINLTDVSKVQQALTIDSQPDNARVVINGKYAGYTPLVLKNLSSDRYFIDISLKGYYDQSTIIDYIAGSDQSVFVSLNPIIGYLSITSNVPAVVPIKGEDYKTPMRIVPVPVGTYRFAVKSFGYATKFINAEIMESEETSFDVELEKASFSAGDISLFRRRINPASPGPLANLDITFQVSGPGSGILTISGPSDAAAYEQKLAPFSTWDQKVLIPGAELSDLEDGNYTVRIDAVGEDGNTSILAAEFRIDSDLLALPRTSLQGVSGQLFNPDTNTLPAGMLSLSTFVSGHSENIFETTLLFVPIHWSVRYGLPSDLEASVSANAVFLNDPDYAMPYSASVAIKKRFLPNASLFNAGAFFTATIGDNSNSDMFANFPGVHLGVPISVSISGTPLAIALTPQISASWRYPSYTAEQPDNGFYAWGYLKSSVYLDAAPISIGLSCSVRSARFSQGLELDTQPIGAGLELNFVPFSSGFVLSAYAFGEADIDGSFYINGGAGFGYIY